MSGMYVKICGLRAPEHATTAALAGADAVGVVMSDRSPRHATEAQALAVIAAAKAARPAVDTVLVVREMGATEAAETASRLGFDVLQLHGGYTAEEFAAAAAVHPASGGRRASRQHPICGRETTAKSDYSSTALQRARAKRGISGSSPERSSEMTGSSRAASTLRTSPRRFGQHCPAGSTSQAGSRSRPG